MSEENEIEPIKPKDKTIDLKWYSFSNYWEGTIKDDDKVIIKRCWNFRGELFLEYIYDKQTKQRKQTFLPPDGFSQYAKYLPRQDKWVEDESLKPKPKKVRFEQALLGWGDGYFSYAGCEEIGASEDDIKRGQIYPSGGDWVVYDKRGKKGVYGISHDDYSIVKVTLKEPKKFGINLDESPLKLKVSTLQLIKRYHWFISLFINYQSETSASPYGYWENSEKLNKAFKTEIKKLENDPYLAMYWLLHMGFCCDVRYDEVKVKVLELKLNEQLKDIDNCLDFFEKTDAFYNINVLGDYEPNYPNATSLFLIRRANLLFWAYSYDYRGDESNFEQWWLSITIFLKHENRQIMRMCWFVNCLNKFDLWERFEQKYANFTGEHISLINYTLASNPNEKDKSLYANKFLVELNENQEIYEDSEARKFVQFMLCEIKDEFSDIALLEKVMDFYFKGAFDSDEYSEIQKLHFKDDGSLDLALEIENRLKPLVENTQFEYDEEYLKQNKIALNKGHEILKSFDEKIIAKLVKIQPKDDAIKIILFTYIFAFLSGKNKQYYLKELFPSIKHTLGEKSITLYEFYKKHTSEENIDVILYILHKYKDSQNYVYTYAYVGAFIDELFKDEIFEKVLSFFDKIEIKNKQDKTRMGMQNRLYTFLENISNKCDDYISKNIDKSESAIDKLSQKQIETLLDKYLELYLRLAKDDFTAYTIAHSIEAVCYYNFVTYDWLKKHNKDIFKITKNLNKEQADYLISTFSNTLNYLKEKKREISQQRREKLLNKFKIKGNK